MGDVRHELEVIARNPVWATESGAGSAAHGAQTAATPSPRWRRVLPPAGGLVLGAAAMAIALWALRPAPEAPDAVAFDIPTGTTAPLAAISPDGRHVVYSTTPSDGTAPSLWLRSLASSESQPIPGTERVFSRVVRLFSGLQWSPDSREIAYAAQDGPAHRGLSVVNVTTGQTRDLLKPDQHVLSPGAWSPDGVILYGRRIQAEPRGSGVWRIPDRGGTPVQVTELKSGDVYQRPSGFLPDGRRFLYVALAASGDGEIRVGSIDRSPAEQDTTALFTADGAAVYARPGHLLYVTRGALMAQPFDADRGAPADAPPVQLASNSGPNVLVSANGRLVYRVGELDETAAQVEVLRVDRKGSILTRIGAPGSYSDVNALADGVRMSVNRLDAPGGLGHLYIVDSVRGTFTRLNPGTQNDYAAAVSRDDLVAFTYSPEGQIKDLYVRPASGVGDLRALVTSATVKHANSWTPDGRFLIYDDHVPGRAQDLMMVRREGGPPVPLLTTEADETFGVVSPDGKWLAYRSTESSENEVYVRDFNPDHTPVFGSQKIQISVAGGDKPRWRHDGREIFYRQGDTVMAVSLQAAGQTLKPGIPQPLFEFRASNYIPYDVVPDGTFVISRVVPTTKPVVPTTLRVLLNWESLIRKP
jgi:Tol biopolymer transport system component